MTKTLGRLTIAAAMLWVGACGGGGGTPTGPTESAFLAGTWRGTVIVQRTGLPDIPGTATFTYALVANSGGHAYRTTVAWQHPWFPASMTLDTAVTPAAPGGHIATTGVYASPRGCEGLLNSSGTATARRIDADLMGSEGTSCFPALLPGPVSFNGHVLLTKD